MLVSLLVVGLVIFRAGKTGESWDSVALGLGVVCVLLAWLFVHTVFTLRYARHYYSNTWRPPIDFNQGGKPPTYIDFAYLAFGVGTAFQVSDTTLRNSDVRQTVLVHSLVSFLFAAAILGITVNLVAGLRG